MLLILDGLDELAGEPSEDGGLQCSDRGLPTAVLPASMSQVWGQLRVASRFMWTVPEVSVGENLQGAVRHGIAVPVKDVVVPCQREDRDD